MNEIAARLRSEGFVVIEHDDHMSINEGGVTYQFDGEWRVLVPIDADLGPVYPDEVLRARLRDITREVPTSQVEHCTEDR